MRTRLAWVLAASVAVPGVASGQTGQAQDSVLNAVRARIIRQKLIRVRVDVSWTEVRHPVLGEDGVIYPADPASPEKLVPRAVSDVQSRGNAAKTGLVVGALAGAVGGAALGRASATFCPFSCYSPTSGKVRRLEVTGALGGAVVVALVGYGIGALIPEWHGLYRAGPTGPTLRVGVPF